MALLSLQEIGRRVAAPKSEAWSFDGQKWTNDSLLGDALEIVLLSGLYRVQRASGQGVWDAPDLQEAFRIAGDILHSSRARQEWDTLEIPESLTEIADGLRISVRKQSGFGGQAEVIGPGGERKGEYVFILTTWPASYVIGEDTINGAVDLDEDIWGKGVCRTMYDAVEQACGMCAVPHGRNLVPGSLNDMSSRFWAKRVAERRVPGQGDPEAEARLSDVKRSTRYVRAESNFTGPEFALAVSKATGWPIRGIFCGDGLVPDTAWCVAEEGLGFGAKGYFREDMISPRKGHITDYDRDWLEREIADGPMNGCYYADGAHVAARADIIMERYQVPRLDFEPTPIVP